jgi:acyl-CoA reductase-like NAD-dependent aldehyde dehydrogenase
MRELGLFIDGQWCDAEGGRTVPTFNPATEEPWATVAAASTADALRAMESAHKAFRGPWSELSRDDRADLLDAVADGIRDREEEFVDAEVADAGGTIRKVSIADIPISAQTFEYYAEILRETEFEETFEEDTPVESINRVVREPYGATVGIVPWNFPTAAASWKIAPAIAAGNTMVLKPSPHTPVTALLLAEVCSQAGLPDGVVNVVSAPEDSLGEALVTHPRTQKITFTGSTPVGRIIATRAAERLTAVTLELGGKSPNIILDDADLETAAMGALFGVYYNHGQACIAGTRLLVPKHLLDDIVERLVEGAAKIVVGDPTDFASTMGPLIAEFQREKVERYVALGLEAGAKLVFGGKRPAGLDRGFYYEPTIFTGVTNDMAIAREEIFGPVLSVIAYEDEAEALAIANDSDYGLAAGIWSADLDRAQALAAKIESGTVWINDYNLLNLRFPFGGYKQSGLGRELGPWGLAEFTRTKHIHVGQPGPLDEKFYFDIVVPQGFDDE